MVQRPFICLPWGKWLKMSVKIDYPAQKLLSTASSERLGPRYSSATARSHLRCLAGVSSLSTHVKEELCPKPRGDANESSQATLLAGCDWTNIPLFQAMCHFYKDVIMPTVTLKSTISWQNCSDTIVWIWLTFDRSSISCLASIGSTTPAPPQHHHPPPLVHSPSLWINIS